MTELVSQIPDVGLSIVLVLIFTKYTLDQNKKMAKQSEYMYSQFVAEASKREEQNKEDIKRREKEYRERERILLEESYRREEILKAESEKREQLLKQEASKRETALINTIEGFSSTMKDISSAMADIKNITGKMQEKVEIIEMKLKE